MKLLQASILEGSAKSNVPPPTGLKGLGRGARPAFPVSAVFSGLAPLLVERAVPVLTPLGPAPGFTGPSVGLLSQQRPQLLPVVGAGARWVNSGLILTSLARNAVVPMGAPEPVGMGIVHLVLCFRQSSATAFRTALRGSRGSVPIDTDFYLGMLH